ncbi:MAG: hypothetical protein QG608_1635 [Actinomycetota bacterium]|nr:hypothetical protein [Actinomycetota bacterium]
MLSDTLRIEFTAVAGESDDDLDRLCDRLDGELSDVGTVRRVRAATPPGGKSGADLALTALTLLTQVTPEVIGFVVDVLRGLVRQDPDRAVSVRIGEHEVEVSLDNPTPHEVSRLITLAEEEVRRRWDRGPGR